MRWRRPLCTRNRPPNQGVREDLLQRLASVAFGHITEGSFRPVGNPQYAGGPVSVGRCAGDFLVTVGAMSANCVAIVTLKMSEKKNPYRYQRVNW